MPSQPLPHIQRNQADTKEKIKIKHNPMLLAETAKSQAIQIPTATPKVVERKDKLHG